MKTLLGQRIREQRRKKGWTMDKLAEKADLSVNYVGDLERGVKTPSLDTFIRIVEALDVPADAEKPADARIKSGRYVKTKEN